MKPLFFTSSTNNHIKHVRNRRGAEHLKIKTMMILTIWSCLILNLAACHEPQQATAEKGNPASVKENAVLNSSDSARDHSIFKELKLVKVIQSKTSSPKDERWVFESAINSPKSITYSHDGKKFYVNSLEGYTTIVFDSKTLKKRKEIRHEFDEMNNHLFKGNENTVFNYPFKQTRQEYNHFLGKPVESCLSHGGKYLWVTYYRRDWDPKAESPSAIAIIDIEKDEIVRVMPSGPLPKMISCSGDNKYLAVTHWGDNTVGIIDVSSANPMDFRYIAHIAVDNQLTMNFSSNTDRDSDCGNCLRGTVFTPDNKKLFVAKMGGNGIAIIDLATMKYEGTITGSYLNLRHLVINQGTLFMSSNKFGMVQKATLDDIFKQGINDQHILEYTKWESVFVGLGARTIDVTEDGKYIFACVNNASKISVIEAQSMKTIAEVKAEPYPVGMAISPDGTQLITTSQGKDGVSGTGNAVMVFEIIYDEKE
jgi:DNA-binding beta-propeller fold protein YncE